MATDLSRHSDASVAEGEGCGEKAWSALKEARRATWQAHGAGRGCSSSRVGARFAGFAVVLPDYIDNCDVPYLTLSGLACAIRSAPARLASFDELALAFRP